MTHHPHPSLRRAFAIAAIGGLLLAACGGDDSGKKNASNAGEETTTTAEETTTTTEATTETTLAAGETTTTAAPTPTTAAAARTTTTVRRRATTTTTAKPRSTTTTTAVSVTVPPGIKGTLKLGTIGTSIQATTGAKTTEENRKIAEAWAAQVNRAGGVNGYKVQVIYKDGQGDTARTLQAVKELDNAGVLAIVGQGVAQTISGSDDYLTAKSLPVLGGTPYTPEFDSHPMFFPVAASYYSGVYGQVAAARDVGAKYFRNMYCSEVAACAQSVPVTNEAARREGLKGDAQAASAIASDYTANCISAKQAGVDFLQLNGMNVANFVRDCQRQNYHPTYAVGGAVGQATIDATKGETVAGNLYEFGIFYDGPEVQRFKQALASTDLLNSATPPGQTSVQAWLGWEMAGAVMKKLTVPNPTRADFLNAMYTIKGETLGGQNAPIDYTTQRLGTGHHAFNDCWTEHLVQDGKYYHMNKSGQIVTKLTFICGTGHTYG